MQLIMNISIKENYKAFKEACEREYSNFKGLNIYQKYNRFILKIFFDDFEENDIERALGGLGSNDRGVDAIFYNKREKVVYLCQFKTSDVDSCRNVEDNRASPKDLDYLSTFTSKLDVASSNSVIEKERKKISDRQEEGWEVRKYFFFMGVETSKEEIANSLNIKYVDFNKIFRKFEDYRDRASEDLHAEGKFQLETLQGSVFQKIKTANQKYSYIGVVTANSLIELHNNTGLKLYDNNVRYSLGKNKVNNEMQETIKNDANNFYYYNNGITISCDKADTGVDDAIIIIENPSVINGAQTLNTIVKTEEKHSVENVSVLCRVIVRKEQVPNFLIKLTKYNNSHNPIKEIDFLSKGPEQKALYEAFKNAGLFYEYKRGLRQTDEFKLNEAKFDDTLTIKLGIASLFQILVALRGEPNASKNVKDRLKISAGKNRPEDDYFETIFDKKFNENLLKAGKAALTKERFKEILIAVYLFNKIEDNEKQFANARDIFQKTKALSDVDFLKNKTDEVKKLSYGDEFQDFYFTDASYIVLSVFWKILTENNLLTELKKIQFDSLKEKIDKIVDDWLFNILSSYFRSVMSKVQDDEENIKNFVKRKEALERITSEINRLKGGALCITTFKI